MDNLKLYSKNKKVLDLLILTVRLISADIGMEFGMEKCAILVMNKQKLVKSEGIVLPDGHKISEGRRRL